MSESHCARQPSLHAAVPASTARHAQAAASNHTNDRLGGHAGGSAKQARDRRFQAILPLRGKILNVERKDDASLYKNNEISSLIVALGLDVKGVDISGLRYGKVCGLRLNTSFKHGPWIVKAALQLPVLPLACAHPPA